MNHPHRRRTQALRVKWVYAWLVIAVAFMITAATFPGIHVDWRPGDYLAIAAVFAIVNLSVGRVLKTMALPVTILTLGLFTLVINTILLLLVAWIMDSMEIDNLGAAFGGALMISIVRALLGFLVDHHVSHRAHPAPA